MEKLSKPVMGFTLRLLAAIIVVFIVFTVARKLPVETDVSLNGISALRVEDSHNATAEMVRLHRQSLLDVLQRGMTATTTIIATSQQTKSQARLSYCAILAGAVALLANRNARSKFKLMAIIIVFTVAMYGMDVHFKDVLTRHIAANAVSGRDAAILHNSSPEESTWYSLNGGALQAELASAHNDSFVRKTKLMTYPDAEQRVYYLAPLGILSVVALWYWQPLRGRIPHKRTTSTLPNSYPIGSRSSFRKSRDQ